VKVVLTWYRRFGAHSLIPVSLFFSLIAVSFGDSPAIPGGAIIFVIGGFAKRGGM
jgi:hypothetical protein